MTLCFLNLSEAIWEHLMQKNAHSRGLSVEIPSAWEEKIVVSQRFPLDNMGSYRTVDRTEYAEYEGERTDESEQDDSQSRRSDRNGDSVSVCCI